LVLKKKLLTARQSLALVAESFAALDNGVPPEVRQKWEHEETVALANRIVDPKAMDIFEVQLEKGEHLQTLWVWLTLMFKAPTTKSIEINLIARQGEDCCPRGSATWIAKALKVEEAQIVLAIDSRRSRSGMTETQRLSMVRRRDRLQSQITGIMECAARFFGDNSDDLLQLASQTPEDTDNGYDGNDPFLTPTVENADLVVLPLPSYVGKDHFQRFGVGGVVDQELHLRQGQANDALHELRLALADKAVIFRTDVRHASNYSRNTRAWGRVASTEAVVQRHAAIYHRCRTQMIVLGASQEILSRYQELCEKDLRVSTAIADPNARGHRDDTLAWFWTMDVPRDTAMNNWMSECLCSIIMLPCP